ncbi:MAG: mechanosensitive ion channel family protein [Anaerolineae bacterium]
MNPVEAWIAALPGSWIMVTALVLVVALFVVLSRVALFLLRRPVRAMLARRNARFAEQLVAAMVFPVRLGMVGAGGLIMLLILPTLENSAFLGNIFTTFIAVGVVVALYRLIDLLAASSAQLQAVTGLQIEQRLLPLIRNGSKLVLFVLAVLVGLQEWGINVSALIASLGIVGLGFSLAAQDTLSNLFGFGVIVGDRPFTVGEFIKTPDVEGIVEDVGFRSTRIRKPDQALITVPNARLASSPVERFARRRVSFVLGVTYETSADQMEDLLERLREMLRVRQHVVGTSVAVYFTGFGDSSLDIAIYCDVIHRDWHSFMREREQINLAVMRILDDMGLSVAFPTRSIYIEGGPPERGTSPTV